MNSVDIYGKSTNHGDHHLTTYYEKLKLKLSFILLCQSSELLLKSILYDIQEKLIYSNIDLQSFDNAHSVNFLSAINRINNFTNYNISVNDKKVLEKCNKMRNEFIHYKVNINFSQLRQEYLSLFIVYERIHTFFYGAYIKMDRLH